MKNIKNIDILQKYNFISFDIFDTLIVRYVVEPKIIFKLLKNYAEKKQIELPSDFFELRLEAERKATENYEFPNIFDIYKEFHKLTGFKKSNILIDLEFEVETMMCTKNPDIDLLLNKCNESGKNIILVSDMYWPADYLKILLNNCGVSGFKKIYVSCDCKASKRKGSIFKIILEKMKIRNHDIVHIGDNIKSDFLMPQSQGIRAIHINKYSHYEKMFYRQSWDKMSDNFNIIQRFIVLNNDTLKNRYWQLGFTLFGPLLWGYTKWVEEKIKENKLDKVFFLSRDGNVMRRAFSILNKTHKTQYMFASRRALTVPVIWMHPELKDVMSLFFVFRKETVKSLVGKMGLDINEYEDKLKYFNLDLNDLVSTDNIENEKFAEFYESIKDKVISKSKEQYHLLIQYLYQIDFNGKIAIVDIGWYGNMQKALTELIATAGFNVETLNGYYIGIVPSTIIPRKYSLQVEGYLFEPGREELYEVEKSFNAIVEWIFSARHGSVLGYQNSIAKRVAPVLANYEYEEYGGMLTNESQNLVDFQNGALDFINKISQNSILKNTNITAAESFQNLKLFGTKPEHIDLKLFGDMRIVGWDLRFHYMARPHNNSYYFKHPLEIKKDFMLCGWRIGFVKRLLRIPFPYDSIYLWLREQYKLIKRTQNGK